MRSSSVWATKMEPGPNSSGVPQRCRYGLRRPAVGHMQANRIRRRQSFHPQPSINDALDLRLDRFRGRHQPDLKHSLGARREDVGRHPARDRPDVHRRLAEHLARRPFGVAQIVQHVQQRLNGARPCLRVRRVRRLASGHQPQPQRAFRARGEEAVGRLAVDQKPHVAPHRMGVGETRPRARGLLVHGVERADAPFARRQKPRQRRHLRRRDALGVAHAAPVEVGVVLPHVEMRRDGVEVGGEHHFGPFVGAGKQVVARLGQMLPFDRKAEVFEHGLQKRRRLGLASGDGRDRAEALREVDRIGQMRHADEGLRHKIGTTCAASDTFPFVCAETRA